MGWCSLTSNNTKGDNTYKQIRGQSADAALFVEELTEIYFTPTPKGLTLSQNSCIDCVVLQNLGFNIYTWKLNRVLFEYEFITNHGNKEKTS